MSAYRDEDEGLRARRDQLRAMRAAEDHPEVAAQYVRRAGEMAAAVWLIVAAVVVVVGLSTEVPERMEGHSRRGYMIVYHRSWWVAPILPVGLTIAALARRLAHRSLQRRVPDDLPLREQIDRLERPVVWWDRLEGQTGWWLGLRLARAPLWAVPFAFVPMLLFPAEVGQALVGLTLLPLWIVPVVATQAFFLQRAMRREEKHHGSWPILVGLAVLVPLSILEPGLVFPLLGLLLVHFAQARRLETRLQADATRTNIAA